ncbi:MAG: TRAP transporter permease [Alphaproteobacteria bacterium]
MPTEPPSNSAAALRDVKAMASAADTGARQLGGFPGGLIFSLALIWSLFHIYIASPLPYILGAGFVLDGTQSRTIHYAFAIILVFLTHPCFRSSPRDRVTIPDWLWAIIGAGSALYMVVFFEELSRRAAVPIAQDMVVAAIGMVALLEAVRRTTGLPLLIVALVFIVYTFAGAHMPEVLSHRGASLTRMTDHMWLSTEGVFGFALGVSSSLVFLFVLFGSLLEKAGAGNWFIQTSFALLGHLRGGPAKAAVVSSALTGMVSGSALANVVTTGTFTIPLMKRVGFSAEKAAGIESTSSINGQLMPPVMGAAAFLMTEFVGISYTEVIKHAFLPAVISYVGLFYIVHLEALKLDLPMLQRVTRTTFFQRIAAFVLTFAGLTILSFIVYYGVGWLRVALGPAASPVLAVLLAAAYIGLLWVSTRVPVLELDNSEAPLEKLPEILPTILAGLHFLIPVVVLIWCLMIERLSPGLSVYWAVLCIIAIMITQRPLAAVFRGIRGDTVMRDAVVAGLSEVIHGLVAGGRNMAMIAISLAAAGIIVGTVSLTGLGLVMVNVIEIVSGGNLLAILFFTAVVTIILGMGLPTTANYVVVASLMAPVVVTLAAQSGVIIPLIAVHLFVFYCGLMSGNTPPVAVDAYAAAALAGADPMRTCLQAFYYGIRTIILPFIFVFNTELLMIGLDSWWHVSVTIIISLIAMLLFVAGCQGYFVVRSRRYESAFLLLIAFSLLRPGFWIDLVVPPFQSVEPARLVEVVATQKDDALIRLMSRGEDFTGAPVERIVVLPLGASGAGGVERLSQAAGLTVRIEGSRVFVDDVGFNSVAQSSGLDFDWEITGVDINNPQPDKEWIYLPCLLLLLPVVALQRRRLQTAALAN